MKLSQFETFKSQYAWIRRQYHYVLSYFQVDFRLRMEGRSKFAWVHTGCEIESVGWFQDVYRSNRRVAAKAADTGSTCVVPDPAPEPEHGSKCPASPLQEREAHSSAGSALPVAIDNPSLVPKVPQNSYQKSMLQCTAPNTAEAKPTRAQHLCCRKKTTGRPS